MAWNRGHVLIDGTSRSAVEIEGLAAAVDGVAAKQVLVRHIHIAGRNRPTRSTRTIRNTRITLTELAKAAVSHGGLLKATIDQVAGRRSGQARREGHQRAQGQDGD